MRCPNCGGQAEKAWLDRYWCSACRKMWLIHELRTYPPPEPKVDIPGGNVKEVEAEG